MGNYNKRDSVTERDELVFGEFFENLLRCSSNRIVIVHNVQRRLNTIKKFNGKAIACAVSQQSNCLADNVPCSVKRDRIVFTVFKNFTGPVIIGVVRR
jgi:hypothetical protein